MLDMVLSICLGVAIIALGLWGALVALPESGRKPFHFWGMIALGCFCGVLTIVSGVRGYYAQKESAARLNSLGNTLHDTQQAQVTTSRELQTADLMLADMNGQMKMIGPLLNRALPASTQKSVPTPAAGTRYQQMTPAELKQEALSIAARLRAMATGYTSRLDQTLNDWRKTPADANSMNTLSQQEITLFGQLKDQYDQCCRMYAVSLREEILRREGIVSGFEAESSTRFYYDNPTNMIGLRKVADDLEKLAIGLPQRNPKS